MEKTAEQVASVYNPLVILTQDGQLGRRIWQLQQQRPVGTVAVVMLDIDPQGHCCICKGAGLWSSQTVAMNTCPPRPVPTLPSAFAGFFFPPNVIVLAVRWYLRFGLMPLWMSSG